MIDILEYEFRHSNMGLLITYLLGGLSLTGKRARVRQERYYANVCTKPGMGTKWIDTD